MAQPIDHAAIKTGQILSIATLVAAYILNYWEFVAALAAIFLLTAIKLEWGPFSLLYRVVLRRLGLVRPDMRSDNQQPHRFGQAVGAATAAAAAVVIYTGHDVAGWALVMALIVLTAISFMGWCIGCFIYYQLNRLGFGGFFSSPPADTGVPMGARPRRS
jgi:hypothetical protein